MTFTEAAIEVLRREGKPLHFKKIAEIAIRESLLDHVGKIPEEVMGGQLATHCRLPRADRRVVAVQAGTFALVEWGLDEDPAGLENMIEPPPDTEIPYRGRERHPIPSREVARGAPRAEGRGRRREEGEERRTRRYPPPAEVAYEILAGVDHPLSLSEIAAQGAERFLMPDAFVRDGAALAAALAEDNRRREGQGRKALFALDGETVSLAAQPEPGERAATPLAPARPAASPVDLRRTALAALRRRVRECDGPTVEHVVTTLLDRMGLRELKVAKRGREHVVYTGRRRLGLGDVRHCVRILRGGGEAGRREVQDVRRDIGNYGAQIGVLVTSGDAARDARSEAAAPGQVPVLLLCGEALADAMTEHLVGCRPIVVPEVDESFFTAALEAAQVEEAARRARRDEREKREGRDEREKREGRERGGEQRERRERREGRAGREEGEALPVVLPVPAATAQPEPSAATTAAAVPPADVEGGAPAPVVPPPGGEVAVPASAAAAPPEAEDDEDEGEEGEDTEAGEPAEAAAPGVAAASGEGDRPQGEGRRRRRRRRRRGGRGRGREGGATAAQATGGESAGAGGAPPADASAAGESARPPVAAALPPPEPERREPAEERRPDAAPRDESGS